MSASPPSPQHPRPARFLAKLAASGLAFVLSLGAAEGALRFTGLGGRPFTAAAALAEIRAAGVLLQEGIDRGGRAGQAVDDQRTEKQVKAAQKMFLHPYFGWDVEGPQSEFAQERELFRNQDPDAAFDVLVLGGSVAAGFGWTGRKALFDALSADARLQGRPLRMFNHALGGYKQPQQLARLAYLFTLGFAPDLVINLDGFNEVALGKENSTTNVHPAHPSSGHWKKFMTGLASAGSSGASFDALAELRYRQLQASAYVQRAEELGLQRSALTTKLATWWIRRTRDRGFVAYERFLDSSSQEGSKLPVYGPEFERKGPEIMELLVETWANASLAIHGMCQAHGSFYLHVLQPTLHDRGSKPLTQEELETSDCKIAWEQGAELGYPMLRKAGAELSAAGVAYFDASMIFADVQETMYFDACHFGRAGNELLGRAIAREYLARLPEEGPGLPVQGFRARFFQEQR